jgi:cell wall-associated NlpC family hydrolase
MPLRFSPIHAAAVAAAVSLSALTQVCVLADQPTPDKQAPASGQHAQAAQATSTSSAPGSQTTKPQSGAGNQAGVDRSLPLRQLTRGEWLARTALAYRGAPYRFGGRSSRSGFDCSGLVQVVCAKWGLYLPRVAHTQARVGVPVPIDRLEPGDLVFFKNTYKRGISHVGIYVGEGYFVHAAGTGKGVRLSLLSGSYHRKHWYGARRLDLSSLPAMPGEQLTPRDVSFDDPGKPDPANADPSPMPQPEMTR